MELLCTKSARPSLGATAAPIVEAVPRRPRPQFPGAIYHVTSRGNRKRVIFVDDVDRGSFLDTFASVVARHGWICTAFCLMGTHYHLALETPAGDLAAGMQRLNSHYAQSFNQRHKDVGHVFQGRYHSVLVEREEHLLALWRYVALNPVRAEACARPEDWRWSSYRAVVGLAPPPRFLSVAPVLATFGNDPLAASDWFRAFVEGV